MLPASSLSSGPEPAPLRRGQSSFVDDHLAVLRDHPDPYIAQRGDELTAQNRRASLSDNGWSFMMIGTNENRAVVSHLRKASSRPLVAIEVWAVLIQHLGRDSAIIPLTRAEIASEVGVSPANVSEVMTELVNFGAITRERVPTPGVRGPGAARYSINPWFATRLDKAARLEAQAKVPRPVRAQLRTIKGGLSPSPERRSRAPSSSVPVL